MQLPPRTLQFPADLIALIALAPLFHTNHVLQTGGAMGGSCPFWQSYCRSRRDRRALHKGAGRADGAMTATMQAMVLDTAGSKLRQVDVPVPGPGPHQVLISVAACGVCRTDLHILDGELSKPKLPLILGHEIVGRIEAFGEAVRDFAIGERVGVPWLGFTDGTCAYCRSGQENLCDRPLFTGYQIDGGYAEFAVADARYVFRLPEGYSDAEAAPLLCAGLIGYRSLKMAGDGKRLGIYGFGAAAHIVAQVARHQGREVYAFTRPGDTPKISRGA